jgi:hypothetical protein
MARRLATADRSGRSGGDSTDLSRLRGWPVTQGACEATQRGTLSGTGRCTLEPQHDSRQSGTGHGILNNELYVGRLVWNRLRYIKDPDTGKRVSRPNPASEWVATAVPELRILEDELWNQVKARQVEMRRVASNGDPKRFNQARRPKYLFSGLTKCAECGGGYVMYWRDRLACFGARSRGTCTNRLTISRQEVEERVLVAVREKLMRRDISEAVKTGVGRVETLELS